MEKLIRQDKLKNAIRDYAKSHKDADCSTILDIIKIMDEMETGSNIEGLLPCPFCGSNDLELEDYGTEGECEAWMVICNNCKVGLSAPGGEDGCCDPTKEEAIAAWNRRVKDG